MKGIILAGGSGTRLHPLTKITNKHLLPVYDRPMIYYPLETLVEAGIEDIMLVTGGNHAGEFLKLLGNGREFGLKHLNYTYQERAGGIAEALGLTQHFAGGDKVVVMLGDNLIQDSLREAVQAFEAQPEGAKILLKAVPNPMEYGVAELQGDRIVGIEEKPRQPKSNLAVIGIYFYDAQVFDVIQTLEPSLRGELEITDVNNAYLQRGQLAHELVRGWWGDAGESIEALLRVSNLVADWRVQ
ncbi:MAG: spore coat protein [Armatimonadetes bacterium CG_4_10_14_3_um_filter_66_18]|nr:NTP transferase domain-containing protein [Armatimonadota bacterium]OIP06756.1 MAG: spore coat protein [Armatimonadetes bacterium CG2_30_66_41]PIU94922.1 MAG: spore coat protein [Armatimonadetes bacterium CG06_land_8_20_14_3_00_66_21]PIW19773.1 MAG: spore coat protein [Armatimonadetes bacterium CG17_big_fil_post_rev_8_21_14_2_50_66_6]PIX40251.1 MAG: spore coat protein [Armatimonadetes bacterium CG_4_8_14_3_um_filter_66_20]PIY50169.1 MAG: spore coat protein [Armatimonadetes bacterium CG_4_10